MGYSKNEKIHGKKKLLPYSAMVKVRKFSMVFWGFNFASRDFLGFRFKPKPLHLPVTLNLEYPPGHLLYSGSVDVFLYSYCFPAWQYLY